MDEATGELSELRRQALGRVMEENATLRAVVLELYRRAMDFSERPPLMQWEHEAMARHLKRALRAVEALLPDETVDLVEHVPPPDTGETNERRPS